MGSKAYSAAGADEWSSLRGALALAYRVEQEQSRDGKRRLTIPANDSVSVLPTANVETPRKSDVALQRIVERVQTLMEASGAAIAEFASGNIVCVARRGATAPDLGACQNRGSASDCIRTGEALLCHDAESDPWVDRDACRQLGVRSVVLVPVSDGPRVVGILAAFSDRPGHFDRIDVDAMRWAARGLVTMLSQPDAEQYDPPNLSTAALTEELPVTTPAKGADDGNLALEAAPIPAHASGFRKTKLLVALSLMALAMAVGWHLAAGKRPLSVDAGPVGSSLPPVAPPAPAAPVTLRVAEDPAAAGGEERGRSDETHNQGFNIRATTDAGSTAIVIETGVPVDYEAHTLQNPDRIYVDIKGASLASDSSLRIPQPPADSPLQKIRVGEYRGVTRVVLDLKAPATHVISRGAYPERLTIELKSLAVRNQ